MKIKQIRLYLMYYFFLGFVRLVQRFQRLYLKFYKHEKQMPFINSSFSDSDDVTYIALITRYLINRCTYSDKDNPDYIQEPEFFLKKRFGNCNDFAACGMGFLKTYRPWIDAKLMIVYAPDWRGHCVCLVDAVQGYIHCSNWGLDINPYPTHESAATSVRSDWNYFVIIDKNYNLQKVVIR